MNSAAPFTSSWVPDWPRAACRVTRMLLDPPLLAGPSEDTIVLIDFRLRSNSSVARVLALNTSLPAQQLENSLVTI